MKIVVLHHHFKTPEEGGAIRSYYLCQALVSRGYQVEVITVRSDGPYLRSEVEGMVIHYLGIPYDNRFGFYKRTWSFVRYIFGAMALIRGMKDVSLAYVISVPLTIGLVAKWAKWRYGIRYIFEVGDLWPEAPIQLGFIRNAFLQRLLYGLEKSIYLSADFIVALSPPIGAAISRKVPEKEVHIVPNIADCDFYQPQVETLSGKQSFNVEGKFVVSYVGAIGYANGLDYIMESAKKCVAANLPIHFFICGDGALLDSLKAERASSKLENLSFINFVNREGVRDVLNITDAAVVCYRREPILETGSPNKFFDGLAAGKLIVINFGGWIKEEIELNQCGIYVDPSRPEDFADQIAPFIQQPELLSRFQRNARALAEEKYSRKKLAAEWLDLIEKKVNGES